MSSAQILVFKLTKVISHNQQRRICVVRLIAESLSPISQQISLFQGEFKFLLNPTPPILTSNRVLADPRLAISQLK